MKDLLLARRSFSEGGSFQWRLESTFHLQIISNVLVSMWFIEEALYKMWYKTDDSDPFYDDYGRYVGPPLLKKPEPLPTQNDGQESLESEEDKKE